MEKSTDPTVFNYAFEDIQFSENNLLGLMGYSDLLQLPEPVTTALEECMAKAAEWFDIRGGYVISDDIQIDQHKKTISSHGQTFESKQIVTHQLRRSESLAWFLCTAGSKVTEVSQQLLEEGDTIKSYVVDVLANVVVDAAMDKIQEELKKSLAPGQKNTNRYSPGYCSWNISEQQKLFKVFPDNFLDVKLTDSSLMLPIKSISAVIGIGKDVKYNDYTCNLCDDVNCIYRNLRIK